MLEGGVEGGKGLQGNLRGCTGCWGVEGEKGGSYWGVGEDKVGACGKNLGG